jgi:hypothetical protein
MIPNFTFLNKLSETLVFPGIQPPLGPLRQPCLEPEEKVSMGLPTAAGVRGKNPINRACGSFLGILLKGWSY